MQPPARRPLVDALDPAVIAFQSPDDGFTLRDDLDRLDRVRAAGAAEAVVLYCTRILEVFARHVLRPFYQPRDYVAENLALLHKYCGVSLSLKRLLDRLRELGNDARHVQRRLTDDDAEVAFVILLRWLHWYFCEYHRGDSRPGLLAAGQQLDALLAGPAAQLIQRLDAPEQPGEDLPAALRLNDPDSLLLLTPVLPAVLAEILLGRGKLADAYAVLRAGRQRFARDVRLRQLEALYWSRRGQEEGDAKHLHRARHDLENLPPTGSPADEETHGILAGIYKRLSDLDKSDPSWLRRCHEVYRRGWGLSHQTNNYLGINAASTALWLDDAKAAGELAAQVRATLDELRIGLEKAPEGPRHLTYWDEVTLAEACLLLGDVERAGALYRGAFARFRQNAADIEVTRNQARRVLEKLGLAEREKEILRP